MGGWPINFQIKLEEKEKNKTWDLEKKLHFVPTIISKLFERINIAIDVDSQCMFGEVYVLETDYSFI